MIKQIIKNYNGFTMIEVIVSTAIIAMLMSITIVRFRDFNQGGQLDIIAQKVISDIRKTQSYALGLKEYNNERPGGGWGIYFDKTAGNNTSYIIYPDTNDGFGGPFDHQFDTSVFEAFDERFESINFPKGIYIEDLIYNANHYDEINITYEPPEPYIFICNNPKVSFGTCESAPDNYIEIVLSNGSSQKIILVNRYGLVDLLD